MNSWLGHLPILDFTASEDSTVGSGDSSLGSGHSLELSWSGDLDTLVSISFGFLLDVPNAQSSTYTAKNYELERKPSKQKQERAVPGVFLVMILLDLVLYVCFLFKTTLLSNILDLFSYI